MRSRVLVVDDDPVLARTIVRALSDRFEAAQTSSERVLDALLAASFDALVTDVMMPSLDGVQLYRWVRANRPKLARRVVFMSGLDLVEVRRRLGELPNPVLFKPFDREAVVAAIEDVLNA